MNKKFVKALIVLSVIGMILSFILISQHYTIIQKGFEEKSFCNINQWINCDIVNASSYSEIHSVPLAGLGFLFYFVIFLYASIAQASSSHKKQGLLFCFYLSFIALVYAAYAAYISFVKLGVLCLLCTGMYLVNLLFFLLLPSALRFKWKEIPSITMNYIKSSLKLKNSLGFPSKSWSNLGIVCLLFALGIFVFININEGITQEEPPVNIKQIVKAHFSQPQINLSVKNRPVWGDPNAAITVVEFSDFQCPYCKRAAFALKPALADYQKQVAFYYIHYPLDNSCNPHMKRQLHPHACQASRASLCAAKEGKFWDYHDLIFKNQTKIGNALFIDLAKQLNLNEKQFKSCLSSPEIENQIQEDIKLAKTAAVSGTPAVFVNGRKVRGWNHKEVLRSIIDEELKRSK